jgi:hypothetical protein
MTQPELDIKFMNRLRACGTNRRSWVASSGRFRHLVLQQAL